MACLRPIFIKLKLLISFQYIFRKIIFYNAKHCNLPLDDYVYSHDTRNTHNHYINIHKFET
jgi:hypothetical protein